MIVMLNKINKELTLTIVIPVYNEEDHLKACLDSIANQTVKPDKVVVVNNNSVDMSVAIASKYSFVEIVPEKKQGIVFARNKGFNQVTTNLIGRIDADTVLVSNWVESVLLLATKNSNVAAFTGPCYFNFKPGMSLWYGIHRILYFWSSRILFGHTVLFGSNMLIRKEAWDSVKYITCLDNSIHEDMDLSHHLYENGFTPMFTSSMRATISIRRFKHGWRYPKMWLKTKIVHIR